MSAQVMDGRGFPILSAGGEERDERFPGVVLVEFDEDGKTTVEKRGAGYRVSDWEVYDLDGQTYWFVRSFFTISQETADAIAVLNDSANAT